MVQSKKLRSVASIYRFILDYIKNGALEVRETNSGRLLGRCGTFISNNIDMCRNLALYEEHIERIIDEVGHYAQKRIDSKRSISPENTKNPLAYCTNNYLHQYVFSIRSKW